VKETVFAVVGAVLLAACGVSHSSPPPPSGAIRVTNDSSYGIDELYVIPSSASDWGVNRAASPIVPTYSLTVGGLAPGSWDVRAVSIGVSSPYFIEGYGEAVIANQTLNFSATDSDYSGSLKV